MVRLSLINENHSKNGLKLHSVLYKVKQLSSYISLKYFANNIYLRGDMTNLYLFIQGSLE